MTDWLREIVFIINRAFEYEKGIFFIIRRYCGDVVNQLLNKPQKQPCDFSIEEQYKTVPVLKVKAGESLKEKLQERDNLKINGPTGTRNPINGPQGYVGPTRTNKHYIPPKITIINDIDILTDILKN